MPHTTTKNKRNKRLDTRPNAKFRQKQFKKFDKLNKIEDLRVTSINSKNRKERETVNLSKEMNKDEKLVRALRKKLNSIIDLQVKQDEGATLDAQQLEKLNTLDSVVADLEKAMKKTKQRDAKEKLMAILKKKQRTSGAEPTEEDGEEEDDDDEEEEDEEDEDEMDDDEEEEEEEEE